MAHIRGRQPVGVDQPNNGGSAYPFVRPSDDILQLFADFFLSYEGLLPGQTDAYAYPFRLAWCYGFGTEPATPAGTWPTPAHAYDLLVYDAADQVVFDSTTSSSFSTSTWDDRLLIVEWSDSTRVCRIVAHTDWSPEDIAAGRDRVYDTHIVPENGVLVADTCYSTPPRLRSLRVNGTSVTGRHVEFVEGYNVTLADSNTDTRGFNLGFTNQTGSTSRGNARVTIDATAGNGLGSFPGCGESPQAIKTINGQGGDSHQNFTIDAEGCLRVQRPLVLTDAENRIFAYGKAGLSDAEAAAAVQLSNDCRNCCDCEYFARTYQGIKRQWFLYREVAQSLERTRDIYNENRARWLAEKAIRESDILRIRAVIEGGAKVAWGISLCNASQCCLVGLKVYLTWVQYINGVPTEPTILPYDCSQTTLDNSSTCDGPLPIAPIVYGDNQQIHCYVVDYLDAQNTLSIFGRQCIADALSAPYGSTKLALHAMVEWDSTLEESTAADACSKTPVTADAVAEDVRDVWTAASFELPGNVFAQKLTDVKIVDPSDPFCRRCQCEE